MHLRAREECAFEFEIKGALKVTIKLHLEIYMVVHLLVNKSFKVIQ